MATTGTTYGGRFETSSTGGEGVFAEALATSGTTYGVHGKINSTAGYGVAGVAVSSSGYTTGVHGTSGSTSGYGVYGYVSAPSGTTAGVYGNSGSTSGYGVRGYVSALSGITYGVYGLTNSPAGYGVYYSGGLAGTGTKSCVVKTSKGPTLMYCQESPENWFEDFGEGQLISGQCHIELDPLFLETVTVDATNPMHVFLQPNHEDCVGLVVKKGLTGFDVVSPLKPDASGVFSYRIVAKRKGFETRRLDYCEAAEIDSYLYPELKEKELRELEEERTRMGKK